MENPLYLLFASVLVGIIMQIFIAYRIRKILLTIVNNTDLKLRGLFDMHFRQIEDLTGLYYELHLQFALPSTRSWAGSPDLLRHLKRGVEKKDPRVIVECSSGVSTLVMAKALQLKGSNGHIYSLEQDQKYLDITESYLTKEGLSEY